MYVILYIYHISDRRKIAAVETQRKKTITKKETGTTVEMLPGIYRTTMSYNERIMLCHYIMKKGAKVPLHNHDAVQNGYVISGKLKLIREDGSSIIADSGTGYLFDSNEPHSAEVLEESELVECFSPMRTEYIDS
jgi:quercetin dioxygenase-like cupin family protein